VKISVDPALFHCKWEKYSPHLVDLWNQYVIVVKRGNSPLTSCGIKFFDVAECEILAESRVAKQKREKQSALDLLKSNGLI